MGLGVFKELWTLTLMYKDINTNQIAISLKYVNILILTSQKKRKMLFLMYESDSNRWDK